MVGKLFENKTIMTSPLSWTLNNNTLPPLPQVMKQNKSSFFLSQTKVETKNAKDPRLDKKADVPQALRL